jgi:hypothetical protein
MVKWNPIKKPENMTWARALASFCILVILVTICISGHALLWGQSVEAITSRLFSIDVIASIFLVSISFWISALLRYKVVWLLVSVVPSLIWQAVGFPLILFTPFEKFSWIPALVTLAMTILFLVLEILEAKYIGVSEGEETITLDLNPDQKLPKNIF